MIIAFQELSAKLKVISLLNTPVISGREISTETAKMQLVKKLVVILSILRLNFAAVNVRTCKEEIEKNKICFKNIVGSNTTLVDSYRPPSPVVVNSTVMLKEVIEINEKESSEALQNRRQKAGLSGCTVRI